MIKYKDDQDMPTFAQPVKSQANASINLPIVVNLHKRVVPFENEIESCKIPKVDESYGSSSQESKVSGESETTPNEIFSDPSSMLTSQQQSQLEWSKVDGENSTNDEILKNIFPNSSVGWTNNNSGNINTDDGPINMDECINYAR